jgi:hypothetical protein
MTLIRITSLTTCVWRFSDPVLSREASDLLPRRRPCNRPDAKIEEWSSTLSNALMTALGVSVALQQRYTTFV